MEASQKSSHNLFEVYLRLRPPPPGASASERILTVEDADLETDEAGNPVLGRAARSGLPPSHITLNPPTDRRRAIEKFAFTRVFEENASQLDVFHAADVLPLVEGVLGPQGGEGTDAVVATLGVTGSGKTHTILGSKSQRGLTQLALDVLFQSIGPSTVETTFPYDLQDSLQACDSSESTLSPASTFLESVYGDPSAPSRASRAATPMVVGTPSPCNIKTRSRPSSFLPPIPCTFPASSTPSPRISNFNHDRPSMAVQTRQHIDQGPSPVRHSTATGKTCTTPKREPLHSYMSLTNSRRVKAQAKPKLQGDHFNSSMFSPTPRKNLHRPSALPQSPDVSGISIACDPSAEYVVVVSMYEVHNDRIYDLLTPPAKSVATKDYRRRPLLFKSTELSPDRKVVAGLRKVICTTVREAILVLEAGLQERRVAGTGSNSVSSRSHGFFCFEVKKRSRGRRNASWGGSKLTIVDLAGSERARDAKTQGATLVEAGKINESLMYLGQCLQTQSEAASSSKPNIVPYRQCKLTELLFSNSFPSSSAAAHHPRRNPQRGVMIVTADPMGDFNATSQILRYSALAREVTVPRIPSITTTILANVPPPASARPPSPPPQQHLRPFMPPGTNSHRVHTPLNADDRATMEIAALEIARLSDDIDQLRGEADRQTDARMQAEAHLLSMEDRMMDLEAAIRDDCASEFEQRLELELARFKASMAAELERSEEHWDRKVDLIERGLDTSSAMDIDGDKENVLVEDLEQEVERLRRENGVLRRELAGRSPTKRRPLEERDDFSPSPAPSSPAARHESIGNLGQKLERMRVSNNEAARPMSGSGSPKKMRKPVMKRWQDVDDLS